MTTLIFSKFQIFKDIPMTDGGRVWEIKRYFGYILIFPLSQGVKNHENFTGYILIHYFIRGRSHTGQTFKCDLSPHDYSHKWNVLRIATTLWKIPRRGGSSRLQSQLTTIHPLGAWNLILAKTDIFFFFDNFCCYYNY